MTGINLNQIIKQIDNQFKKRTEAMIEVIGKRWFDTNGNTYHSCVVYRDDELIGATPFAYGYDDGYKQTAYDLCNKADLYIGKGYVNFTRMDGIKFSVTDVRRKKDLDKLDTTPVFDNIIVRELELSISNDGDLYRSLTQSIHINLSAKHKNGTYSHNLAIKAFKRLADQGTKKYVIDQCSIDTVWNHFASPSDRKELAKRFADNQLAEMEIGNYTEK